MIQTLDRNEEYEALVAFTTLAPLAVGGLIGLLVYPEIRLVRMLNWAALVVLATGLLALAASIFHLGRPWRAPLALLRLSTSWLSREVLLFGLFLVAVGLYAILPALKLGGPLLYLLGFAGVLFGLAGTVATGETYRLHARPYWDHWLAVISFPLGALSTGSLFGLFLSQRFTGSSQDPGFVWVGAAVFLVVALIATCLRSIRRHPASAEGRLSRQLVLGPYRWMLVVRVAAGVIALVLIGMGGEVKFFAWILALLGEFADRVLFFKGVVPVTLKGRYL